VESFVQEMKRYLGLNEEDAELLRQMGPRMDKYLPGMADRFYAQIPLHPNAARVLTGGPAQIERLKQTLREWARGLFSGVYDEAYAEQRYHVGYRHVRAGLDQKYVISAMGNVRTYLSECLLLEYPASDERLRCARSLSKILDLDLNLMCESYMHATLQNLRSLNAQLEFANRELDQASKTKDEFLAHTSHELRTPLNSILGFTKLILDGLCKDRDEEQELLRDVYASAQHLLGIVNDILDLGRIEAGKMSLHIESLNPRDVLDSTIPLVSVQATEKALNLVDDTRRQKLPLVRADEVRFRQILLNLLSNSVKFTPQGSVTLRSDLASHPGFLRIEVEDTGIGIPEEKREAVFQKFVQVNVAQVRRQGGSGLGLAITRKLVQLMGGEIGLDNGAGDRGTLVWFTLPLAAGSATDDVRAKPAETTASR